LNPLETNSDIKIGENPHLTSIQRSFPLKH